MGSGETATFTGPEGIAHVIAGVSGPEASSIDGTLRSSIPGVNLWLFNPNGVVFGAGAKIDVRGSFHAAAADSVGFEGGLEPFPADPGMRSVLATAPPAAFGFLPGDGAASLAVEGPLEVTRGEAKLLAGGDVLLSGAEIRAPAAHLGFEASGQVQLTDAIVGGESIPSLVDVGGEAPGTISIRGGKILIEKGSQVLAENSGDGAGGSISLVATARTESVIVDDGLVSVSTSAAGNAGAIEIESPEVVFRNGPGLVVVAPGQIPKASENPPRRTEKGASAETTGSGAAGTIAIKAGSLVEVSDGAGLSAQTVGADGAAASGHGGTVRIADADRVEVLRRGFVSADSWASSGNAGTIKIDDVGALTVDGDWLTTLTASSLGSTSRFEAPPAPALGNAGTIEIIRAGPVRVLNGGLIQSDCFDCESGNRAGEVRIVAESLKAEGLGTASPVGSDPRTRLGIGSNVSAFTLAGAGDAGTVELVLTGSLEVLGGAELAAGAFAEARGNAGRVSVKAHDVIIERREGARGTGIFAHSGAFDVGAGRAGEIEIEAHSLSLGSGSAPPGLGFRTFITAATGGSGAGGSVSIKVAEALTIAGDGYVTTATAGQGDAGSITLDAGSVQIRTGGFISTNSDRGGTSGGRAGPIQITARDSISITNEGGVPFDPIPLLTGRAPSGTGIVSATVAGGAAGSITLEAPEITVTDGAVVSTSTVGGGAGGDIALHADRIRIANGGFVDTASEDLTVFGRLFRGGDAGHVTLEADRWVEVGGAGVLGTSFVSSRSVGEADAGAVTVRAPRVRLFDGGTIATNAISANGGDIAIQAQKLVHLDAGEITASVGGGTGGNITIDPVFVILQNGSSIRAEAGSGSGGQIRITADNLFQFPGNPISVRAGDPKLSGTVEIHSPDVNLAGSLAPLPSTFLDAASLMRERCAARRSGERAGSFAVRGPGGIPAAPDGWLPASMFPDPAATPTAAASEPPSRLASLPGARIAPGACP